MSDRRPPSLSMTILLPLAVVPLVTGCDSQAPPTAADAPSGPSTGTVGAAVRPGGLAAVFDRSTESGSVYLVEPDGGNRKGSSDATRPDFLLLYPAYDPAYEAPTLPLSPPEVSDDCGALENVEAIEDYLESAAQLADGAVGSVEACAEQVRALAEEVLGLIADANDSGPGTLADLCSLGTGPTAITPSNPVGRADGCSRCADQLSNVAKRATALREYAGQCGQLRQDLQAIRDRVIEELSEGELSREMACLAEGATSDLERVSSEAGRLVDRARRRRSEIAAVIEEGVCCASTLEESCGQCDGGTVAGPVPAAVVTVPGGPALGRVLGTLRSTANRSDDPGLAAAFDDLASRLARTPRRLVRRIAYPASVNATEDYIALGRSGAGERPSVLILSAVPRERLPPLTIQDEARWFRVTAAWRSIFRGEVVQPPS